MHKAPTILPNGITASGGDPSRAGCVDVEHSLLPHLEDRITKAIKRETMV